MYSEIIKDVIGGGSPSIYIVPGSAILSLEIAIVNTIKPSVKVIVTANRVYGDGFRGIEMR